MIKFIRLLLGCCGVCIAFWACTGTSVKKGTDDAALLQPSVDTLKFTSEGVSNNWMIAKQKAMSYLRKEFAQAVHRKAEAIWMRYMPQMEANHSQSYSVDLSGIQVLQEHTAESPDGKYEVEITACIPMGQFKELLLNYMKGNEKMKINPEDERFRKIFDEELRKSLQ